jgi:small multidrug resistance pump
MRPWVYLSIAILSEVVATSALKSTDGFHRPWPTAIVLLGYSIAFYFLSLTLDTIPIGVAYAVWSGAGMALIALAGWLIYGQRLDAAGAVGMGLIVAGVAVLNLFSRTVVH